MTMVFINVFVISFTIAFAIFSYWWLKYCAAFTREYVTRFLIANLQASTVVATSAIFIYWLCGA